MSSVRDFRALSVFGSFWKVLKKGGLYKLLSRVNRFKPREWTQKELEEQSYRLNIFLEIISEADLLLLKRLIQDRKEKEIEEKKP